VQFFGSEVIHWVSGSRIDSQGFRIWILGPSLSYRRKENAFCICIHFNFFLCVEKKPIKSVLLIRIRDPVPFGTLDTGSGMRKIRIRIRDTTIIYESIIYESLGTIFGLKILKYWYKQEKVKKRFQLWLIWRHKWVKIYNFLKMFICCVCNQCCGSRIRDGAKYGSRSGMGKIRIRI